MKNILLITLSFLICGVLNAQIKMSHAADKVVEAATAKAPYDSTRNYIGNKDIASYIGQELLVNGDSYGRENGVQYFYSQKEGTIALGGKSQFDYRTPYHLLDGKTFIVREVVPDSRQGNYTHLYDDDWWFKLENKDNPNEVIWFKYSSKYEHTFQFITMSYYNYLVNNKIGDKIICAYRVDANGKLKTRVAETDVNTGKIIDQKPEDVWTVKDVALDDKWFDLVFIVENQDGIQSTIPTYTTYQTSSLRTYWLDEYNAMAKLYGKDMMETVRGLKVRVGMPEELVLISWGEPDKINRDSTGSAQWVYKNQYVYIKDGVVTAWN
ncbi:MAG: hypothetical protein J5498_00840 [Bacteroidales bacterium]|nr:hypothetical protein [Bacteroidales bacterium]